MRLCCTAVATTVRVNTRINTVTRGQGLSSCCNYLQILPYGTLCMGPKLRTLARSLDWLHPSATQYARQYEHWIIVLMYLCNASQYGTRIITRSD